MMVSKVLMTRPNPNQIPRTRHSHRCMNSADVQGSRDSKLSAHIRSSAKLARLVISQRVGLHLPKEIEDHYGQDVCDNNKPQLSGRLTNHTSLKALSTTQVREATTTNAATFQRNLVNTACPFSTWPFSTWPFLTWFSTSLESL